MTVVPAAAHGLLGRVLLPETDAGVAVQVVVLLVIVGGLLCRLSDRPEWRLVTLGAGLLVPGSMGLRAAH